MGFWAVGFTTGWALTFKAHLGLSGIWLGILSGVFTTGVCPSAVARHRLYVSCCWSKSDTPLGHLARHPQWRLHHRCLPLQRLPFIVCMFHVAVPRLTHLSGSWLGIMSGIFTTGVRCSGKKEKRKVYAVRRFNHAVRHD